MAAKDFTKCKKCKQSGYLVMSITVCDEVCEACGTWQDGVYNDVYARVG
jgi:hypothetical protein